MNDKREPVKLSLPAKQEYALVARMALSGMGVLAGLDVDLIGDLRTVAGECFDCLCHQSARPNRIDVCAWTEEGRLHCCFEASDREECACCEPPLDLTVTKGVLETLMPEVNITNDDGGVKRIQCSMRI